MELFLVRQSAILVAFFTFPKSHSLPSKSPNYYTQISPKVTFEGKSASQKWYHMGILNSKVSGKDPGNQRISANILCVKKISSKNIKYKYVNGDPEKKIFFSEPGPL